mmetsp:Transcript_11006/g.14507  ORF Transcript_11006/g.14507 Transcript_11006/m.14507 type:complete len:94 (+) Transcript_11006:830-1111(+)
MTTHNERRQNLESCITITLSRIVEARSTKSERTWKRTVFGFLLQAFQQASDVLLLKKTHYYMSHRLNLFGLHQAPLTMKSGGWFQDPNLVQAV